MEFIGIVEHGVVVLPEHPEIPEGARVRVFWEPAAPLERDELRADDVEADLAWARKNARA